MTSWRNRIVGAEEVPPETLTANPKNWRLHPPGQKDALAALLDQVGWVSDVIVNQRTGLLVDGHLRVELAVERSEPTVPVKYVDLDEREESTVLATLDPIGAMAEANDAALKDLLAGADIGDDITDLLQLEDVDAITSTVLNDRGKGRMHRNEGGNEVVSIGRFIGACDKELVRRVEEILQVNDDTTAVALRVCEILLENL